MKSELYSDNFGQDYPMLVDMLMKEGDIVESRNGNTREVLNFKTTIMDPHKRCVGGQNRNINIFFLMAESLWIWSGRKDLEFLNIFNKNMAQFSDDGISFNAPYGWRIRNFGESSIGDIKDDSNKHAFGGGIDQMKEILRLLQNNPDTRRAVIAVWNPEFDLINQKSFDLACNTQLMFKIRGGLLHTTICNRSNDLHWGLPTNLYQFSFVTELMTKLLGINLGTQTHLSQSLHIYDSNPITDAMKNSKDETNLYDIASPCEIDLNFSRRNSDISFNIQELDHWVNIIITSLLAKSKGEEVNIVEESLKSFSVYLYNMYKLLDLFVDYSKTGRTEDDRVEKIMDLNVLGAENNLWGWDNYMLCLNWFYARLKKSKIEKPIDALGNL